MKTSFKNLLLFSFLSITVSSIGQNSQWYLQLGGGYFLLNQIEQLGFESKTPAGHLIGEIGKTFQPLSIGVQQSFLQRYSFYRYDIKQRLQTVFAKYSLNHLTDLLPYGLDPYVMVGASFTTNRFITYQENDAGILERISEERTVKPGYTYGAGIQVGSRKLILGLQYQYTASKDDFTLADFNTLPFATGSHLISLNVGLRIMAPQFGRGSRCPRFGGKGFIRF